MRKKLFTIALSAIMIVAMAVPAFADVQSVVNGISGNPNTHLRTITLEKNYNEAQQIRLNVFTSTEEPVSGQKVTTWINTESATQKWGYVAVYSAGLADWQDNILANSANPDLCLNITRSGANPEANVYTMIGNRFGDVSVTIDKFTHKVYMPSRYIHKNDMYLTTGGSITGSGGGAYLYWSTSGSTFYNYDISSRVFEG